MEDYTNLEYRAFCELNSSEDLTCRTLLGCYFSDMAASFSKCTVLQKGNKSIYQKGSLVATEYLSPFVHGSTLDTIGLYNRNGVGYSLSKQQITQSCSPLNEHARN